MRIGCVAMVVVAVSLGACDQVSMHRQDEALACVSPTDSQAGETAHGFTAPVPVQTTPLPRTGTGTRVIYLNRYARAYVGGIDDAQAGASSVVASQGLDHIAIGGFQQGDDAWQSVVTCVRAEYAAYDVAVTDIRPVTPGYVEAHFGGNGTELSLTDGAGGIAPIDNQHCNIVEGAPVFIFSDLFGDDTRSICEVGAHEIAHTFSLDHEWACHDPMTYVEGCGDKAFVLADEPCGEGMPRQCICGRDKQNSVAILTTNLGQVTSDTIPPTVELLPPIADPSGEGTRVQVRAHDPNGALGAIELHVVHQSATGMIEEVSDCDTGRIPCTLDGELASFDVPPETDTLLVWAVAEDTAGNRTSSPQTTINPSTMATPILAVVTAPIASMYPPNGIVEVEALVLSAAAPREVTVVWSDGGGLPQDVPMCPLGDPTAGDGRWGVAMHLGNGLEARTFHVRVTDQAGRGAQSNEQPIPVSLSN